MSFKKKTLISIRKKRFLFIDEEKKEYDRKVNRERGIIIISRQSQENNKRFDFTKIFFKKKHNIKFYKIKETNFGQLCT